MTPTPTQGIKDIIIRKPTCAQGGSRTLSEKRFTVQHETNTHKREIKDLTIRKMVLHETHTHKKRTKDIIIRNQFKVQHETHTHKRGTEL